MKKNICVHIAVKVCAKLLNTLLNDRYKHELLCKQMQMFLDYQN